jgi:hypothetical protein
MSDQEEQIKESKSSFLDLQIQLNQKNTLEPVRWMMAETDMEASITIFAQKVSIPIVSPSLPSLSWNIGPDFQLFVKIDQEKTVSVTVNVFFTVFELKEKLKTSIPNIGYLTTETGQLLKDEKSLLEHGITSDTNLFHEICLRIEWLNEIKKSYILRMLSSSNILDLKKKLGEKELLDIPPDQQTLLLPFLGKELKDALYLVDYSIGNGSVVHLRTRGKVQEEPNNGN